MSRCDALPHGRVGAVGPSDLVSIFTPTGSVGGVEEVARQAQLALAGSHGGACLHLGVGGIARSRRPTGPWMALTWKTHALTSLRHPGLRGPSILWLHGAELTRDGSRAHHHLRARSLEGCDLLVAVSPLARHLLPDDLRAKVQLVGPPIPAAVQPTGQQTRSSDRDQLRLLSVGRAIPRKGHDTAIEVARVLAADGPVRLDLVGPGPDLPRLERLAIAASRPGLQVFVHGEVDTARKNEFYAEADALLFLPRRERGEFEGLGMVQLEAAAYGCPAVVLDCGGSKYGVAEGRSGLVLDADAGPQRLADAVRMLVGKADARDAAVAYATHFSLEAWQHRVQALASGLRPNWAWPVDA